MRAFLGDLQLDFTKNTSLLSPTLRGAQDDVQTRVGIHDVGHLTNLERVRAVLGEARG